MDKHRQAMAVHLRFSSAFEMLDLVQLVCDQMGRILHLEPEALHWAGVAVRESVINAIKHGNRHDIRKLVFVDVWVEPARRPEELIVVVRDQGEGFEAGNIADPLAPENLLKSSGRGIFFMRSFMDQVTISRRPEGGMEVRMVKKLAGQTQAPNDRS
jgi:serine/threonine-protein kinase RsbW